VVRDDGVVETRVPDQAHAQVAQTLLATVLEPVFARVGARGSCIVVASPSGQQAAATPAPDPEPTLTRRERVEQAQQTHPEWSPQQIAEATGVPAHEVRAFQRREDEKSAHQRLQAAFVAARTQEDVQRALAATEVEQHAGHLRPSAYKALVERTAPAAHKRVTVLAARAQHPEWTGEMIAATTDLPYHIVRTHLVKDGSLHPVAAQGAGA
jgi:hypothetical protein